MKKILFVLITIPFLSLSQSFMLTVNNGYGTNIYSVADTVHVFAREEKITEIFETWTGDTLFLDDPSDWHAVLKMPAKNIAITAKFKSLPLGAKLTFERMKGRDTLKPVYYYFPEKGQKVKALVWIYHGSGGNYTSFAEKPEGQSIIKALIADSFAVAMSECDEATFHQDFDNDGNLRWDYTVNPVTGAISRDMTNQVLIRDTFIKRGNMSSSLPEISLGFSAGGAFSLFGGWVLGEKKGVSFCSQGTFIVAEKSTMPSQYFQSFNDNHPDVGKLGNDTAFQNYTKLLNRGICAAFNMFYPWPCYPEYFRRIPGIDSTKSNNIFIELKSMNALTAKNYGRLRPDQIVLLVKQQPAKYPALISLSPGQLEDLDDQLQILLTFHHYHSHFNGKMLRFFNETCGKLTTPYKDILLQPSFTVFPNPANDKVYIKLPEIKDQDFEITLFDMEGRAIKMEEKRVWDRETMAFGLQLVPAGLYFIVIRGDKGYIKIEKLEIH